MKLRQILILVRRGNVRLWLVSETKQLWVVEVREDCDGAEEAASSTGNAMFRAYLQM